MIRVAPLAVLLLAPLAAGCSGLRGTGASAPPGPVAPPADVPPSLPATQEVLVSYRMSGPVGGPETLIVHGDGTLELSDDRGRTREAQCEAAALDRLWQLLSSPAFATLAPAYGDPRLAGGAGCVLDVTGVRTITVADGATVPAVLRDTLVELGKLRGLFE